jgi:2,3-bisphosphoglycerate-independent phosphoglycerate mutase
LPLLLHLQAQHTAAVVTELSSQMQKLLQSHPINDQQYTNLSSKMQKAAHNHAGH